MNEDILGLEYDLDKMKKNIRDLMTDSHMTQEQLERKTGISQSRISKVLNSKKNSDAFTIQQLVSIAQVFGVSTDQILGLNIPTKEKKECCSFSISNCFRYNAFHFCAYIPFCRVGRRKGNNWCMAYWKFAIFRLMDNAV